MKSFKFVYSYFKNTANTVDLRLKLDEVQTKDNAGNIIQRYKFTYHTNNFSWDLAQKTYKRDYWGYYNGRSNSNLIPVTDISYQASVGSSPITISVGGANREPDTLYLKEGVLKKIEYPTGGFTSFQFEPHTYLDNGVAKFAGGLRIKSITSDDGNGGNVVKNYKYGNGETGYGVPNFFLSQSFFMTTQVMYTFGEQPVNSPFSYSYKSRMYFSNSSLELDSYEGSTVVYPYVTEYYGSTSSNIGKISHVFDDGNYLSDLAQVVPTSSKNFKNSYSWKRGNLTSKSVFDSNGNLLTNTSISYAIFQTQNKTVGQAAAAFHIYSNGGPAPYFPIDCIVLGEGHDTYEYTFMGFVQSSGKMIQSSVTENTYQPGDITKVVQKATTLTYDPVQLQVVSQSESGNVSSEVLVTKNRYPFNLNSLNLSMSAYSGNARGWKKLYNKHIISNPIEQYNLVVNSDGTNPRVLSGKIISYKENIRDTSQTVVDKILLFETDIPVAESGYSTATINSSYNGINNDSKYKAVIAFGTYDNSGNPTEVAKTNDVSLAYLWGYDGSLPLAEVTNSDVGQVLSNQSYAGQVANITATTSGDVAVNSSFALGFKQNITGTIQLTMLGTGGPNPPTFTVKLKDSNGSTWHSASYGYGTSNVTINNLPVGTYTYYYSAVVNPGGSFYGIRLDVTANYQNSAQKVFHTSFEEEGVTNSSARTGKKVWSGIYTMPLPSQTGQYTLSYWKKSGANPWQYFEQAVSSGTNISIGVIGDLLDEVRLFPVGAKMTTYTYDPGIGLTSVTDPNNLTSLYGYDKIGRLEVIRDDQGKILKTFQYNYKQP